VRAYFTFYRTLAFPLIGISLICAHQVWQSQSVYFIYRVLWVKVLTSIVIGVYIALFRSSQFIFYNNLGYSRTEVFLFSFGVDFMLWVLIMALTAMAL